VKSARGASKKTLGRVPRRLRTDTAYFAHALIRACDHRFSYDSPGDRDPLDLFRYTHPDGSGMVALDAGRTFVVPPTVLTDTGPTMVEWQMAVCVALAAE